MTYEKTYKYRSVWMGIAIIWIMLFHAGFFVKSQILRDFLNNGFGGTDIFLFASGLGCAYSYARVTNLFEFIKRRFIRVYPAYLIFMMIWIPCFFLYERMPLRSVLGNLFGIEYFFEPDYSFNWYYSFILFLYLITPVLVEVVRKYQKTYQFVILLTILFCFTLRFIKIEKYIIMAARLPIYVTGIWFSVHFSKKDTVNKKKLLLLFVFSIAGIVLLRIFNKRFPAYMWNYGLYWYPYFLITPGLCFCISFLCETASQKKFLNYPIRLLGKTGQISLELYFMHIFLLDLYRKNVTIPKSWVLFLILLVSFPIALGLRNVTTLLLKKLSLLHD